MKYLKRHVARTVLVVTKGETFKGTLVAADADMVALDHATVLSGTSGPLDGQVVVPMTAVTWVQVV
ncbi:hypothetical protein [Nocardioides sp.]|uniref:hypothetical protein n=1 Tax=Nocardioides sp. TaxID=35761 RepID=UPI0039E2D54B